MEELRYIERKISKDVLRAASMYPVVTIWARDSRAKRRWPGTCFRITAMQAWRIRIHGGLLRRTHLDSWQSTQRHYKIMKNKS